MGRNGTLLALSPPDFTDLGSSSLGFGDRAFMSYNLAPKADHGLREEVPIPYSGLDTVTRSTLSLSGARVLPVTSLLKRRPSLPSPALSMPPGYQPQLRASAWEGQSRLALRLLSTTGRSEPWDFLIPLIPLYPCVCTCTPLPSPAACPAHSPGSINTCGSHVEGVGRGPGKGLQLSDEQRKGRLMGSFISGATSYLLIF